MIPQKQYCAGKREKFAFQASFLELEPCTGFHRYESLNKSGHMTVLGEDYQVTEGR